MPVSHGPTLSVLVFNITVIWKFRKSSIGAREVETLVLSIMMLSMFHLMTVTISVLFLMYYVSHVLIWELFIMISRVSSQSDQECMVGSASSGSIFCFNETWIKPELVHLPRFQIFYSPFLLCLDSQKKYLPGSCLFLTLWNLKIH